MRTPLPSEPEVDARDALQDSTRSDPRIAVEVGSAADDPRLPGAGSLVVARVRDNGIGMEEDVRRRVFEPFFTTKELWRGTGLGLATCHAIVRDLGGVMDVETRLGGGTTFSVLLPAVAAPAQGLETLPDGVPARVGLRILVIDDEPQIRRVIERALESFGHEVVTASSRASVTEQLDRGAFDVVLLDRSMPGTPGAALLPLLRERAPLAKVVYFTGQEVEPHERDVVDGVLHKPVGIDELVRFVEALVGSTR